MSEKYNVTAEQEAMMPAWREKWREFVNSTGPYTEDEKTEIKNAVNELYVVLGYKPPEEIIFVRSPMEMRVLGGIKAAKIKMAAENLQEVKVRHKKPFEMSLDDWYRNPYDFVQLAIDEGVGKVGLECMENASSMYDGGNQWAGFAAYVSFFREVVALKDIDFKKWLPYEVLAKYGPRLSHEQFCIVCERPLYVKYDAEQRGHSEEGPYVEWSDGFAYYQLHGERVPARIIERPDLITVKDIDECENAELRRMMINRYGLGPKGQRPGSAQEFGAPKFLRDAGSRVIHEEYDEIGEPMRLHLREVPDDEPIVMVELRNSTVDPNGTRRTYFTRVPPTIQDCYAARNWMCYLEPHERFFAQT